MCKHKTYHGSTLRQCNDTYHLVNSRVLPQDNRADGAKIFIMNSRDDS
jgi:hypothetical protein